METVQTFLLVLQVLVAIALIGIILIQHGKGADAGAAFGSGASTTVFGSQGSANFLTKATTFLAVLFLANSLFLGYLAANASPEPTSVLDEQTTTSAPAGVEEEIMGDPAADTMTGSAPSEETSAPAGQSSDVPVLPEQ